MKAVIYRILVLVGMCGLAYWVLHSAVNMAPADRRFMEVCGFLFLIYFAIHELFEARVELREDGMHVEQYADTIIPYSEIRNCVSFYSFPWQTVVITTRRRFPLSILLVGDKIKGRRRSLIQDGELAIRVKARMASSSSA